jgi:hypothetical protein
VSKVQERGDAILEFQGERRQSRLCICPKEQKPMPQMPHGKSLKLCKESRRVILNLEKGGEQVQSQQKIQNRCPASMADLRDIGKGRRAGPVSP